MVAALVGAAVLAVVLWLLAGLAGSTKSATSGYQQMQATVVSTGSCQSADGHDIVTVHVGGRDQKVKLDACGHQPGETVGVLVPGTVTADTLVEPSAAAPGNAAGATQRMAFGLLIVAAAVGGGGVYLFLRGDLLRGARPAEGTPEREREPRKPRTRTPSGTHADYPERTGQTQAGASRARRDPRQDPDETGVDWFVDSSTSLEPVDPPSDLAHRRSE